MPLVNDGAGTPIVRYGLMINFTKLSRGNKMENMDRVQVAAGGLALSFIVGYMVGAGRWNTLLLSGSRLLTNIGTLAFNRAISNFEERSARS